MPDLPGFSTPQKHKPPSKLSDALLPALEFDGLEFLKEVEDDIVRQLAEKRINISLVDPSQPISPMKVRDNEQNVKNHAREKRFLQEIEEYVVTHCSFVLTSYCIQEES